MALSPLALDQDQETNNEILGRYVRVYTQVSLRTELEPAA